ncbi:metallophosphoesterase [Paenibacillus tarimensis]
MQTRLRIVSFIGLAIAIYTLIHYYIGWHGRVFLESVMNLQAVSLYWAAFWIVSFGYLGARLLERFLPGRVHDILKHVGAMWLGVLMYCILLLPLADVAVLALRAANVPPETYIPIIGYIIISVLILIIAVGSWNAWNPVVRKYSVHIDKTAGGLKMMRIAVASDLHLGTIVRNKHLKDFVERINALQPDLILLPGDIIDDDIKPFVKQNMAETIGGLQAPHGVYAVLGNHEYMGGHVKEFAERLREAGVDVLFDESVRIGDALYVIGRKDKSAESPRFGGTGRKPLAELLEEVDPAYPLILMDHQPYHLKQAAEAGIDISLSGHTHRGQLTPNHWITRRLFELDWGYKQFGRLHAFVSSGYGMWGPPLRIGSRAEIIELTVHFEAAGSEGYKINNTRSAAIGMQPAAAGVSESIR